MKIQNCTVFCGSRDGHDPAYQRAATELGTSFANENLTLVYGGGGCGIMGAIARAVLKAGGQVKGITTDLLEEQELSNRSLTDLKIVADMPTRKNALFEEGDAYIVLPGGVGTFDELMEVLVNRQLGLHEKPILILNIQHWADPLLALLKATIQQGFAPADVAHFYSVADDVPSLMTLIKSF